MSNRMARYHLWLTLWKIGVVDDDMSWRLSSDPEQRRKELL